MTLEEAGLARTASTHSLPGFDQRMRVIDGSLSSSRAAAACAVPPAGGGDRAAA